MARYEIGIIPRPRKLGGGWILRMTRDGEEVEAGTFPLEAFNGDEVASYNAAQKKGVEWLNSQPQGERSGSM
ncbi:MAG: hypothetical protein FWD67_10915 [Betaproteobacteria bacterium]|nr:hypothetical protein [Betaproteobacteria bacterium]